MNWKDLLISKRTGQATQERTHSRTEFQRDYDRIIFSAPFRRLQNKTQVFPLPGSIFVHNRLTHSIEVASVGRSLGSLAATELSRHFPDDADILESIPSIVSAGCLAHDMGNPPFGHSGEKAIQHYFAEGPGKEFLQEMQPAEQQDLLNFDGNANTFRLLSHSFAGRRNGGYALTYPTLAAIVKYPRSSYNQKKFGFFQQDKATFQSIAETLRIPVIDAENGLHARHPLVYLVEAADDICYQAMDVEDAYRLGIFSYDETRDLMMNFYDPVLDVKTFESLERVCQTVTDPHEQVSYMRSILIGLLVRKTTDIFCDKINDILEGRFTGSLVHHLEGQPSKAMRTMEQTAIERIYRHQTVAQIELSGFTIIGTLLDKFLKAQMRPDLYYSSLVLPFIPEQFRVPERATTYDKAMSAVDTVSGMTDLYALDLYKKITGEGLH